MLRADVVVGLKPFPFPYLAVTKLTSNAPENLFALNVPLPEYQIYTAGIYAVLNCTA